MVVEGNHYFPAPDVRKEHLRPSASHTTCHWKGAASYYDVVVGDKVNRGCGLVLPDPMAAAERIKGRIPFWRGVRVEPSQPRSLACARAAGGT